MDGIIYKNGHTIPKELIVKTLERLGCTSILGNDYRRETEECISYLQSSYDINNKNLRPDFNCKFNGEDTPVEVGNLTEKDKINIYLNRFKYVIHIFADDTFFLLHCVLYQRKDILKEKQKSFLKNTSNFINGWLEDE